MKSRDKTLSISGLEVDLGDGSGGGGGNGKAQGEGEVLGRLRGILERAVSDGSGGRRR